MRYICLIVTILYAPLQLVFAQNCWTNTAGRSFQAELTGLTETHALFAMPDGTTNRLALAALNPGSQKTARQTLGLPEIPACFIATFNLCRRDLVRIDNLYADGRLDQPQWADARAKILTGFQSLYQKHELPPSDYASLEMRLLSGK